MRHMEFLSDTPEVVKKRFEIQGACQVNGVLLTNMSRYQIAKMSFSLSKTDLKYAKKHLKDCPECRTEIAKIQGKTP